MAYQIIYSSQSTIPMQSDDLEELLEHARTSNAIHGISGALIYADGTFLQILEGDRAAVQALMARISRDLRHETVTILREGEIPSPRFSSWRMAFVSATREQVAKWAGFSVATGTNEGMNDGEDRRSAAQFAQDILGLLVPDEPCGAAQAQDGKPEPGVG